MVTGRMLMVTLFLEIIYISAIGEDEMYVVAGTGDDVFIKQVDLQERTDNLLCSNNGLVFRTDNFVCIHYGTNLDQNSSTKVKTLSLGIHLWNDNHSGHSTSRKLVIHHHKRDKIPDNTEERIILDQFLQSINIPMPSYEDLQVDDFNLANFENERRSNVLFFKVLLQERERPIWIRFPENENPLIPERLKEGHCFILHDNNGRHSKLFLWVSSNVTGEQLQKCNKALGLYSSEVHIIKSAEGPPNPHLYHSTHVKVVKQNHEPTTFKMYFKRGLKDFRWGAVSIRSYFESEEEDEVPVEQNPTSRGFSTSEELPPGTPTSEDDASTDAVISAFHGCTP